MLSILGSTPPHLRRGTHICWFCTCWPCARGTPVTSLPCPSGPVRFPCLHQVTETQRDMARARQMESHTCGKVAPVLVLPYCLA